MGANKNIQDGIGGHTTILSINNQGNFQLSGYKFHLGVVEFVKKLEGAVKKYRSDGSVII